MGTPVYLIERVCSMVEPADRSLIPRLCGRRESSLGMRLARITKGQELDYWDDQNSSRTRNKSFRLAPTAQGLLEVWSLMSTPVY